jgi:integrase
VGRGAGRQLGFPNVTRMMDRHGKVRFRFRRKGLKTVYLPGLPGSAEFAAAYEAATSGSSARIVPGASRTIPGTINALAVMIYGSAEWAQLSKTTQSSRRGIIERVRRDAGTFPVAKLEARHVLAMRDKRRDTPSAANNLLKVLRWMMAFAVSRGLRSDNPVVGIKPLKISGDGFHTWTEAEIAKFEARWPVGTRERLAFDLLLWTIQRSGDVRLMGRQNLKGGYLTFTQAKTGAHLTLPVLPPLAASLAEVPKDQMLFVATFTGEPFTAKGFGNWFSAACREAGLPHCSAHGLRKSGATRLADNGSSESEIMAWTGHSSPSEVQRYTRGRDQRGLADRAVSRTHGEQPLSNHKDRLAK